MRPAPLRCFVIAVLLFACGGAAGASMTAAAPASTAAAPRFAEVGALDRGAALAAITRTNFGFGARLLLGALSLGGYAVFAMVSFGYQFGGLVRQATQQMPVRDVVLLLAPHGLLEIPALALLASLEFQAALGVRCILRRRLVSRDDVIVGARSLSRQALLGFAALGLAALIEVFATKGFHDLFIC